VFVTIGILGEADSGIMEGVVRLQAETTNKLKMSDATCIDLIIEKNR